MEILGLDIGGSGIKGAIVDSEKGILLTERYRIDTPRPATPKDIATVVQQIIDHFNWQGPIGCGFPTPIKNGICITQSNLHSDWVGLNVEEFFQKNTGSFVTVINDADAAGLAEMRFGAGKGKKGFVLVITVGTGLGSGAFVNGRLLPNFELGQMYYKDYKFIEQYASNAIRKERNMTFKKWGKRFNNFLNYVNLIVSPDLFILGGGGSKYFDDYKDYLNVPVPVIPAQHLNEAGIIGAAMAAMVALEKESA